MTDQPATRGRAVLKTGLLLLAAGLAGCSGNKVFEPGDAAPANPPDVSGVPDAVPRVEPRSRYGNPESYVVHGKRYHTLNSSIGYRERGMASWYGTKFHGRRTSSGEAYDMYAMTAAHKTLPLPSYVEVTNLSNGRKAVVKVNDRGPFHTGRIIDLSYAAAVRLGIFETGTGFVEVQAIDAGAPTATAEPLHAFTPQTGTPGSDIYLQVGAFQDQGNATRMQARLEQQHPGAVRVVRADTGNGTFYKVQIGPLADNSEAERIAQELKPLGIEAGRSYARQP